RKTWQGIPVRTLRCSSLVGVREMPMSSKGARLYFKDRRKEGRRSEWIIRDGAYREGTGIYSRAEKAKAEQALADYLANKYRPPTGLGQLLQVEEVISAYLRDNINAPSYEFLDYTAQPILRWWREKKLKDVMKANCEAYVAWRTSQHVKRHPNSKKPPRNVSIATAWHELKTLRAALNHYKAAHDSSLVVPKVTLPPKPAPKTDYWLSRDEVARRLRICRKHPQLKHLCRQILIGVCTGTRPGAILTLRWLPSPNAGY